MNQINSILWKRTGPVKEGTTQDNILYDCLVVILQIDISSDMCNRIVKNAVKVMQGKEVIQNLFDEAQFIVFKELLPYWAGFLKTYKPPEDPSKVPRE